MSGKHTAEYYLEWRKKAPNYHRNSMLSNARQRAKRLGLPCTITAADIQIPATCPVLGIPLAHQKGAKQSENSPTVDRIIPSKGYVPGNVIVVSLKANRIKNNASVDELVAVAEFYRNLIQ